MRNVLSIVNQKGGVGKTTTSIHLASGLAIQGRRVLLLDLDPQGNSTIGLGLNKDQLSPTLYEALLGMCSLSASIYRTRILGLDISPSNIHLSAFELESRDMDNKETLLKNHLESLQEIYDYLIIDCPPSLGMLTLNALNASRWVIIPALCEFFTLDALAQLGKTFALIKENSNSDLEIMGILPSMVIRSENYQKDVLNQLRNLFGSKLFRTVIPRDGLVPVAANQGVSLFEMKKSSAAAHAYKKFVKEVINYEE